MGKYELPPDYKCPYCGTGHDADYDVWEGVDFEGENDIECKHWRQDVLRLPVMDCLLRTFTKHRRSAAIVPTAHTTC